MCCRQQSPKMLLLFLPGNCSREFSASWGTSASGLQSFPASKGKTRSSKWFLVLIRLTTILPWSMLGETVIKCGVPGGIPWPVRGLLVCSISLGFVLWWLCIPFCLLCSGYSNSHISPVGTSDLLWHCFCIYLDVPVEKTCIFSII